MPTPIDPPATAATMPDQRSLAEQVSDLWRFARDQKMYDAQDWLAMNWSGPPLPFVTTSQGTAHNEAPA